MPRPQFSLKTVLWLMAVVGAYFAGSLRGRNELRSQRQRLAETIDYYIKHRTDNDKALRDAVAENAELRERLGLEPVDRRAATLNSGAQE